MVDTERWMVNDFLLYIIKRSHDNLLYTKKETSHMHLVPIHVLFCDKTWVHMFYFFSETLE